MARTKIVCTLGPASTHAFTLRSMIRAGMDVARLNLSYGEPAEHRTTIKKVRKLALEEDRAVAILADLAGPKFRLGRVSDNQILREGRRVRLVSRSIVGTAAHLSVTRPKELLPALKRGDRVMIHDGNIELEVQVPGEDEVTCRVVIGGALKKGAGINLPRTTLDIDCMTPKDKKDIAFCVKQDVDFIGLSFVRTAKDVQDCRDEIKANNGKIAIIAKLEKSEAVANLKEIIDTSYGVMVARGDLGIEIPLEDVPIAQKRIIAYANRRGKPVITATEMLLTMVSAPRPTRAEAADVANAIIDGTDAVMLSEETARGKNPTEVVRMMERIARASEEDMFQKSHAHLREQSFIPDMAHAVAHSAVILADEVGASLIISPTDSGDTPRRLARHRPKQTILALSTSFAAVRRLALSWGVIPWKISRRIPPDRILSQIRERLLAEGLGKESDLAVLAAGYPFGANMSTGRIIQAEAI